MKEQLYTHYSDDTNRNIYVENPVAVLDIKDNRNLHLPSPCRPFPNRCAYHNPKISKCKRNSHIRETPCPLANSGHVRDNDRWQGSQTTTTNTLGLNPQIVLSNPSCIPVTRNGDATYHTCPNEPFNGLRPGTRNTRNQENNQRELEHPLAAEYIRQ